ncbi:galactosylceramide sulfotransferase-like [Amphiura filiformis]|uniref:galactosylceramide sulfotransferase-like n=1 Tax=Amphiura filiformis TaxID=82378 RepID=UPI003B21DBB9
MKLFWETRSDENHVLMTTIILCLLQTPSIMDNKFVILFTLIMLMVTNISFTALYYSVESLQIFVVSEWNKHILQPKPKAQYHETCKPHDQLVFIKTHKTGSTTLQLIVQIYGYFHNSSFVFNAANPLAGHIKYIEININKVLPPVNVAKGAYTEYMNNFDMSAGHFKYNLRDPAHQFESAFMFFGHAKQSDRSTEVQINTWLNASKHGDRFLDNNQMLDLGLPAKDFRNHSAVMLHIQKLSREFDLMLLNEYFDESLLLLRKLMCWSFDDILYIKQNARTNASRSQPLSESTKDKIRNYNVADTSLYEYFNQTFWKKIAAYGPSFNRDLQYFKNKQTILYNFCIENTMSERINKKVALTLYNTPSNTTDYCNLMANNQRNTFERLWNRQQK